MEASDAAIIVVPKSDSPCRGWASLLGEQATPETAQATKLASPLVQNNRGRPLKYFIFMF
jgi:hypothetical protein